MSDYTRLRRQQLVREAEGYLDIMTGLSDRCQLEPVLRDRLGKKALAVLAGLDTTSGQKAHALYLTGQIYRAMERYSDAVAPLKQSVALQQDSIHVWLALGWCYKRLDRIDLAIEALEQAFEVNASEAIIHYNLACYWSLAGNVKLSVMYLAQAFELDPDYRELVREESDFNPIRKHPYFQALTSVIV